MDDKILIGLTLIFSGVLVAFIMSYDKEKKSKSVLGKTSKMNGWGLAILLIILGIITFLK